MKYFICGLLVGLILPVLILGAHKTQVKGFFIPYVNLCWCDERSVCIHEIGHYIDYSKHWISSSIGFLETIVALRDDINGRVYFHIGYTLDDLRIWQIIGENENNMKEVYAEIYQYFDGCVPCMPKILQEFYIK